MQSPKRTTSELEAALPHLRGAPADAGTVELIVRRPAVNQREVLDVAILTLDDGLQGDTWNRRGSSHTPDGGPHLDMQLTLMNTRIIELIAGSREYWPLAGDQFYVDLNLSDMNLPPGTRLAIGDAVVEVSTLPHTGCGKFVERFGLDAMKFVNSPVGRQLNLRGINAHVVSPGTVRRGDPVRKIAGE